jgi:ABC-type tungstate transport system substrate-binding protein
VFLSGVIGGAILGLIFARVHDRYLRSSSLRTRGIIFGLILWILLSLSSFGSGFGLLYDIISVIIGLVAYLVYGMLLARFFPRFKRNILDTRKESDGQQATLREKCENVPSGSQFEIWLRCYDQILL